MIEHGAKLMNCNPPLNIQNIDEIKIWFFEKINGIDKILARFTKKKLES